VPDFDDIVESGGAQFRGDVCEHIPLGCLRVGVGHRRSLSSAGGLGPHCCNDTISPILPTDDAIDAQMSTSHEHSRSRQQTLEVLNDTGALGAARARGVTPAMPAPWRRAESDWCPR